MSNSFGIFALYDIGKEEGIDNIADTIYYEAYSRLISKKVQDKINNITKDLIRQEVAIIQADNNISLSDDKQHILSPVEFAEAMNRGKKFFDRHSGKVLSITSTDINGNVVGFSNDGEMIGTNVNDLSLVNNVKTNDNVLSELSKMINTSSSLDGHPEKKSSMK